MGVLCVGGNKSAAKGWSLKFSVIKMKYFTGNCLVYDDLRLEGPAPPKNLFYLNFLVVSSFFSTGTNPTYPSLRVVQGGLWQGSRTEKTTNHGYQNIIFPDHERKQVRYPI